MQDEQERKAFLDACVPALLLSPWWKSRWASSGAPSAMRDLAEDVAMQAQLLWEARQKALGVETVAQAVQDAATTMAIGNLLTTVERAAEMLQHRRHGPLRPEELGRELERALGHYGASVAPPA